MINQLGWLALKETPSSSRVFLGIRSLQHMHLVSIVWITGLFWAPESCSACKVACRCHVGRVLKWVFSCSRCGFQTLHSISTIRRCFSWGPPPPPYPSKRWYFLTLAKIRSGSSIHVLFANHATNEYEVTIVVIGVRSGTYNMVRAFVVFVCNTAAHCSIV